MGKADTSVPSEYLIEMGKIMVNFAVLESVMYDFASQLTGLDDEMGQGIVDEMSFSQLVEVISSLYEHKVEDQNKLNQFHRVIEKVKIVEEKRNSTLDALWMTSNTNDVPSKTIVFKARKTVTPDKGFQYKQEQVSIIELNTIVEEISNVVSDVEAFMLQDFQPFNKQ